MQVMDLITLSVTTEQEAFDAVARHLATMPERAVIPNPKPEYVGTNPVVCVYETDDGKRRCALGALMVLDTPEKHQWARTTMGGVDDVGWTEEWPEQGRVDYGDISWELLAELQNAHDTEEHWGPQGFDLNGWAFLADVAVNYGLNTDALPEHVIN